MNPEHKRLLIAYFEERIPFNKHLGMRVVDLETGFCSLVVPFADHLVGDASRPALHGGVISALADAAGGLAAYSTMELGKGALSTLDLRVDYLRPALLQDITCEARVVRVGSRVAAVSMNIHQGERVAAECRAVYSIIRSESPDRQGVNAD